MNKELVLNYLQKNNLSRIELKAVLFDMDGVLFDSMKNHAAAWYKTITAVGIPCTPEEFYLYEGRVGASTINLLFERTYGREATDQERKEIYHAKSCNFAALGEATPMAGAATLLEQVRALGLTPVLVTGSGQATLLGKLNHHFPHAFDAEHMVTAFDVKHGKPHPEPYLMGLQKAGVEPHQAIVVENAPLGVTSAVAAGIFTIAANTGPLPNEVLLEAGANHLLPSISALNDQFATIVETLASTAL